MTEPRKTDFAANRILAALPKDQFNRLARFSQLVSLRQNSVLFEPKEPIKFAYFPIDSLISLVAYMWDGRSVEVTLTGNEGLVGLRLILGAAAYWYGAVVQVAGRCIKIDSAAFRAEFRRGSALHDRTLEYIRYLLVQTSQNSACNRLHVVQQRLARYLLMIQDRTKADEYAITHEFFSQMLGAPRADVSLAAGALRKSGLIRYARGKIRILDRQGLQSAACECYSILTQELQSLHS